MVSGALFGCDEKRCALHSDCQAAELCVVGTCEPRCGDDFDCPVGEACQGGACLVSPDSVRPRPCDPAASELSCSDGLLSDTLLTDVPASDQSVEVSVGDVADASAMADTDAVFADGSLTPPGGDLTGTYAVTKTVELTNDMALAVGQVSHLIATLSRGGGNATYRLELIDQRGQIQRTEVAVDFRAPEGPTNYQFAFDLVVPAPEPTCIQTSRTFQRGLVEPRGETLFLVGEEDLRDVFEPSTPGALCDLADRLTTFQIEWVRLPTPSSPDAGGAAIEAGLPDAVPSDAVPSDAVPSDAGLSDAGLSDAVPSDAMPSDAGLSDAPAGNPADAAPSPADGPD